MKCTKMRENIVYASVQLAAGTADPFSTKSLKQYSAYTIVHPATTAVSPDQHGNTVRKKISVYTATIILSVREQNI